MLPKTDQAKDLKLFIERHGGMVTEVHECFTYQIRPLGCDSNQRHFFAGSVYSAKWLIDSVVQGQLLDKEPYCEFINTNKACKRIEFRAAKPMYTLTEAVKTFEIAIANQSRANGSTFWKDIER